MPATSNVVLAVNAGSSSVKFALYKIADDAEAVLFSGSMEGMGTGDAKIKFKPGGTGAEQTCPIPEHNDPDTNEFLTTWLSKQVGFGEITAVAHRVVFGMDHTRPERITPALLVKLKSFISYDPEHLPSEIRLIELFLKVLPQLPQMACFDTMFHQTMPVVAQTLSIPVKYRQQGLRRYGFHGISYQYLSEQLSLLNNNTLVSRVVIAHLGSGASLAALKDGKSIDTSMGFSPCAGIPMSTRSGDLDPGVAIYLLQQAKLSSKELNDLVNHQSGLLGISETSADLRQLLKISPIDHRAEKAVDLFCYQVSKYIGAYAAALGGLDTLIFSGGIGEHLPEIRKRVCKNLGFLGIELDHHKNLLHADIISKGKVCVRVIPTNEELMMARLITRALADNI